MLSSGSACFIFFLVAKHHWFSSGLDSPCAALVGTGKGRKSHGAETGKQWRGDPLTNPPFHSNSGGSTTLDNFPGSVGLGEQHLLPLSVLVHTSCRAWQLSPALLLGSSQPCPAQALQEAPSLLGYLGVCFSVKSKALQGGRRKQDALNFHRDPMMSLLRVHRAGCWG